MHDYVVVDDKPLSYTDMSVLPSDIYSLFVNVYLHTFIAGVSIKSYHHLAQ